MKVTEHIKKAKGKTLFSFEIIPPQKGQNIQKLYDNINPLMEFKPPFIDVTTSREEHVYIKKAGGLLEKKVTNRTVFVIEASSYQLEYSKLFSSNISIILNIFIIY